jgi:hypothetical protein
MNTTRLIYNSDFYKIGAIVLSEKYAKVEKTILDKYSQLGCPIPVERFKTVADYHKWVARLSEALANDVEGLTPGYAIDKIMKSFNIRLDNDLIRKGLNWKLFFGLQFGEKFGPLLTPIKYLINSNPEECNVSIKIYPWTKQDDYYAIWEEIKTARNNMSGYRKKEQFRTGFERDFLLYQLYQQRKTERANGIKTPNVYGRINTNLMTGIFDDPQFIEICKKHGKIGSPNEMKKIVLYFNKLLKGIALFGTPHNLT